MNLYIRYFNHETVVGTLDDAFDFLVNVSDIELNDPLVHDVTSYLNNQLTYPKRFKIAPHRYFIMIGTVAPDLEEFKRIGARENASRAAAEAEKDSFVRSLTAENPGWYKATVCFKRVTPSPDNLGKFIYADTIFEVKLKAHSIQDCYDRVMDHLHRRSDIDSRSQLPSIKGRNFQAQFLGMNP